MDLYAMETYLKINNFPGKNLEYGLKQEGLLSFVRELNGNEEEPYDNYLRDASMYARGNVRI